ncbi:hydrolase 2, exosortase A system-associated [Uliginosibacterium sp. sgz301328]|uniref:hydrolase 2, exosortase A system-associated n=1 Tax=Uliginosibacterium sp. sgz301328 TaxID=3243764 RepID=UPI00359D5DA0
MHTIEERGFYLPAARGELFCVLRLPRGNVRGAVLAYPPFAEELNKCRRMMALAAHAMAEQGWAVLQVDLFGTGDAEGDFGEADWAGWLDDLSCARQWLKAHHPGPQWAWAVRAGALLAADALHADAAHDGLLLWQPQLSGKTLLGQFLRLKIAASLGLGEADRIDARAVRQALMEGQAQEIAGYLLNSAMAAGLEAAAFDLPSGWSAPVRWLEVGRAIAPASATAIERLRARGVAVDAAVVEGPSFWQTVEVEVAPALIAAGCHLEGAGTCAAA